MTTTTTATCRFRGHVLQVSRLPHGTMSVGIDGWLVATAATATTALHEIGERLRLEACEHNPPTLPKRFRDRVHAIADGGAE
jgi:hypothetical protein